MENDKKKPTFEPVSAEEAKKIRATGNKDGQWNSGVLCESGITTREGACIGKSEGADCCYYQNGNELHGKCVEFGLYPPGSLLSLKCVTSLTKLPFDRSN
ncbi:MAG: hypothetical protein K2L69_07910 [Muribaculaceae bacterium]|nr:hypothetical protein [Muribaculaceae bacterium]MDE6609499.1 hypothetical protein [Muribaculaceae bacterium]